MTEEESDYAYWFWYNVDLGPADWDIVVSMEKRYEEENGKKVPQRLSWRNEDD
jgi:hypothetical protein